eukprot:scaffold827_cov369-Prasinococcus_capsulatus_cf.AAC.16
MCNPDANATYDCEDGSEYRVGLALVEDRYAEPEGPNNYDLWKFQASKLVRPALLRLPLPVPPAAAFFAASHSALQRAVGALAGGRPLV